ncbi:hypothetical protein LOTGIDRAFT_229701 [Lottia gigantea]|uniref:Vitellogenin domain-containing protein n=1 Tax=Lottia gigantea TaxID=225164 RepID=V4B6R2_LOTGI|nr:hypothetical protein LOTGIDRAFT_229701 [Lottia gigantea]ESO84249.1 hypothetical protein LOTGIDRAFT_229701 [Lottia gigantea]
MAFPIKICIVFSTLYVLGSCLQYEVGKIYKYSYDTSVSFTDIENKGEKGKNVGYQLQMDVDISVVYKHSQSQIFKLKITSAMLTSASRPNQEKTLGTLLKYPFYFELSEDSVNHVYVVEHDSVFCTNIKKGIAAFFQVQREPGARTEVDVSGECSAVYSKTSKGIIKTKEHCENMEIAGQFSTTNPAAGVTVKSTTTLNYEFKENIISKLDGINTVLSIVDARSSINGATYSSQGFNLKNTVESAVTISAGSMEEAISLLEKDIGQSLIISLLPSGSERQQCTKNKCIPATEVAVSLKDDLVNDKVATLESAKAFIRMVKSFRNSGKNTMAEVFSSPESYYIIPQLIDVAAATQTGPAHDALMELLNFEDDSTVDYIERYLLAAAYVTHPDEFMLKHMLKNFQKTTSESLIRESLLLSMSAVLYTFCQVKQQCQLKIVNDVKKVLLENITQCEDDQCKLMYLRALGNAGFPDTISTILEFSEKSVSSMVSFTAISALRRISKTHFTFENKRSLLRIFHQTKQQYDSSVRLSALNALLRIGLSVVELEEILLSCQYQTHFEISTYVIKKITDEAEIDMNLKEKLNQVLQRSYVNNYHTLSQRGKSSSLTSYLAKSKDVNSTYTLSFETTNSGIMKRSGMIVNMMGKNWKRPFMHFDIYADGLESLLGDSDGEAEGEAEEDNAEDITEEEGVEATAGMSLTLFDVILKQIEFFRGTAGLMSAAWNAPSELTSALQVNVLLQDHSEKVHLSNGMIVDIQVQGVTSLDLSGLVSISLWSRNSHSVIKNRGGMYLEGTMKLDSTVLNTGIIFSAEGELVIDFITDVDFYEMPLKLCLQMERPDVEYKQKFTKYEKLKGFKSYRYNYTDNFKIPSTSFLLNTANSKQCKQMFQEQ